MIADNVPIYGSRRRSYIIMNGLIAFLSLLFLIPDWIKNKYLITFVLTTFSMTVAWTDVIVDALMV